MARKMRQRRTEHRPDWIEAFKQGRAPLPGEPGYDAFMGWRFFGESIPGLPDEDTAQGNAMLARAKNRND